MKLAVKLLKRSDLTFFEPQYRKVNAGNQKSLNLNRAVLVDRFYPSLGDTAYKAVIPVRLSVWGPDGAGEAALSRSITKEAKNWRLNGEFVHNPDCDQGRFDDLQARDIALLRFDGAAAPQAVRLVLLSAAAASDSALHARLEPLAGNSMRAISAEALLDALAAAPADHPARLLVADSQELADLEDAAGGDSRAARRLGARRQVTREDLAAAQDRATQIGGHGEALVAHWLAQQVTAGFIRHARWASEENAVHPFDFEIEEADGARVRIEVKTTTGDAPRAFHISLAEVESAAESGRHDLYRLCSLTDDGAILQVSRDIASWANSVRAALSAFPDGIRPQSFLVDEAMFSWSDAVRIEAAGEEGDDDA